MAAAIVTRPSQPASLCRDPSWIENLSLPDHRLATFEGEASVQPARFRLEGRRCIVGACVARGKFVQRGIFSVA